MYVCKYVCFFVLYVCYVMYVCMYMYLCYVCTECSMYCMCVYVCMYVYDISYPNKTLNLFMYVYSGMFFLKSTTTMYVYACIHKCVTYVLLTYIHTCMHVSEGDCFSEVVHDRLLLSLKEMMITEEVSLAYVCMYVSMYICMYVFVYVCISM